MRCFLRRQSATSARGHCHKAAMILRFTYVARLKYSAHLVPAIITIVNVHRGRDLLMIARYWCGYGTSTDCAVMIGNPPLHRMRLHLRAVGDGSADLGLLILEVLEADALMVANLPIGIGAVHIHAIISNQCEAPETSGRMAWIPGWSYRLALIERSAWRQASGCIGARRMCMA